MDGLKLAIRKQIAPHVATLVVVQTMPNKVGLHWGQESGTNPRNSGGTSGNSKRVGGGKEKGKGHLGVTEEGTLLGKSTYVLVEKKKLVGLQKKNKVVEKKLQHKKKKNQGKQPWTCALR